MLPMFDSYEGLLLVADEIWAVYGKYTREGRVSIILNILICT